MPRRYLRSLPILGLALLLAPIALTPVRAAGPVLAVLAVGLPVDIALDPPLCRAYVVGGSPNGILSIVDACALKVLTKLQPPGSSTYPLGVAADPRTHRVYLADATSSSSGFGWILYPPERRVTQVPLDPSPIAVAGSPRLGRAYFSQAATVGGSSVLAGADVCRAQGSGCAAPEPRGVATGLTMVDGATGAVLATAAGPGGRVAVDDRLGLVYIAAASADFAQGFDAISLTGHWTATFEAGANPAGVAAEPETGRVYFVLPGEGSSPGFLVALDGTTGIELGRAQVGASPFGVGLDASRRRAYVANANDDTVSIVDTPTMTTRGTVAVGRRPYAVAAEPFTHRVYVGHIGDNTLWVLDGTQLP